MSPTLSSESPSTVRLMAVGDVMLARSIGTQIIRNGSDIPFAQVAGMLEEGDLQVANLECTISDEGTPEKKGYTFRAPVRAADALVSAGFDVVSQANNHALDYGSGALEQTRELLSRRGIAVVGAGEDPSEAHTPIIVERNGLRMAFLGFVNVPVETGGFDTRRWIASANSPGLSWALGDEIARDVVAARKKADLVIVLLHSGYEGQSAPNAAQRAAAHAAIDAGATLVLGSHPHVLQGTEKYKNGFIIYSLGNFVFDGYKGDANDTAILEATLDRQGVSDLKWIPIEIENGLPRPANDIEAARILARVKPLN